MKITNLFTNPKHYLLLMLVIGGSLYAQQDPQYTQYMYNTMSINPAYTGSPGTLEANLLYRSQWVGVEGAPETQAFGIHSPLANRNIGLGLNIVNDKIGPSNELFFSGNFSYTIQATYNTKLAFGVKAGLKVLDIDFSKGIFYDPGDILLTNNIQNQVLPTVGAGVYYFSDKWYVGFSVPNFFMNEYYDDVEEAVMSDRLHYYLMGGYVFNISDNLKFKPAVLAKAVSGAPISFDISSNFLIQEIFTVGVSYRYEDAINVLAGIQVFDSFFVGYSYDYSLTDFQKYNDGSHEIILRYHIPEKSSRIKSPRFF